MTDSTNARKALKKVEKCVLKGQRIVELHLICSSRHVKKMEEWLSEPELKIYQSDILWRDSIRVIDELMHMFAMQALPKPFQ